MAAPAAARVLRAVPCLRPVPEATRHLHTTPRLASRRGAARVRVGKGDKPVSYEKAHPPHYIAHRKGWLSLHTGNPGRGAGRAASGRWKTLSCGASSAAPSPASWRDEAVLKRRANLLVICAVLVRGLAPAKLHFLVGYTETLLSHFYKCPVRLELQTVPARVVYKYL
ncbi:unnamed protein product [Bubo scandiacus]